MNGKSQMRVAPSISGHMIDLGVGHSIAMYERNGVDWVAEFRDDRGEFMYAGAWFHYHAGGLRYSHKRRTTRQSALPLTPEVVESIERLHRESEAREERMLTLLRSFATAAQRYWASVMSRLRGGASQISQTLG